MSVRSSSRVAKKPLAPLDNLLNSAHVPVYKRLRQSSVRKRSMAADAKLHLYDFETEGNDENCKKFKKTQKIRKRARIYVRKEKENARKPLKNGSKDYFGELRNKIDVLKENCQVDKAKNEVRSNGLKEIQVEANVHSCFTPANFVRTNCRNKVLGEIQAEAVNGYSPVDDDIISVASEQCDELTDVEDFHGFGDENEVSDVRNFIDRYGDKTVCNAAVSRRASTKLTPNPYYTPNPYATPFQPDHYKTPRKASRNSYVPIIEFNESIENQLQPNNSTENIYPNNSFNNVSCGPGDKRFFSTPCKNNSFNSSDLSDLSSNDFNLTNCFGFEEPDNFNEEFLVSPIKENKRKPVLRTQATPSRPQLPSVEEIINKLKEETEECAVKPTALFAPEVEVSVFKSKQIEPYMNSSSFDYISKELTTLIDEEEPKVSHVYGPPTKHHDDKDKQVKLPRRSYERPAYLRQRKNSQHEESDVEEEHTMQQELQQTKAKKQAKPKKKKAEPTKREMDELEKWAQMFNSQCAQVDAFNLVVE